MCISPYFFNGKILKKFNLWPDIGPFHLSKRLGAIFPPSSDVYTKDRERCNLTHHSKIFFSGIFFVKR